MKKHILIFLVLIITLIYAARIYYQFGDTAYPTAPTSYSANYIYYMKVNVTHKIILDSLYCYAGSSVSATGVKFALYNNNSGTGLPSTFIDSTNEKTGSPVGSSQLHSFAFVNKKTIRVGTYWIAQWQTGGVFRHARGAGGSSNWGNEALTYGAWPISSSMAVASAFSDIDTWISGYYDKDEIYLKFNGHNGYKK